MLGRDPSNHELSSPRSAIARAVSILGSTTTSERFARDLSRWEIFALVVVVIGGLFYLIDWLWRRLPPYDPPA